MILIRTNKNNRIIKMVRTLLLVNKIFLLCGVVDVMGGNELVITVVPVYK